MTDFFVSLGFSLGTGLELGYVVGLLVTIGAVALIWWVGTAGMPRESVAWVEDSPVFELKSDPRALARAQVPLETARAQLKRDLKAGRTSIHDLLLEPPDFISTIVTSAPMSE